MKKSVVTTARSMGDVLTRMNSKKYGDLDIETTQSKTITEQYTEALIAKRMGKDIVSDLKDPTVVFSDDFSIAVIPDGDIPEHISNFDEVLENQQNAVISKVDDTHYEIGADLSKVIKFQFKDGSRNGDHQWVALSVTTGEESIEGILLNGVKLTEKDVEEAISWGLAAGSFVLWVRLDEGTNTAVIGNANGASIITFAVLDTNGEE